MGASLVYDGLVVHAICRERRLAHLALNDRLKEAESLAVFSSNAASLCSAPRRYPSVSISLPSSSSAQPVLQLLPLRLAQRGHLLLGHVVRALDLVERVVRVLLELLADLVDLLLSAQTLLVFHLVQPAGLVRGVSGLEAALRVAVDLVIVALGQV